MPVSVDVIIVNWNAGRVLTECLQSIAALDSRRAVVARLVIVDNASTDDSIAIVRRAAPGAVLIENAGNRGFAAACNQGAAGSASDYLLFLNPDTILFPDSIDDPVELLESPAHRTAGICGIRMVDERDRAGVSVARFPSLRIFFGEMTGLARLWPSRFPPNHVDVSDFRDPIVVDQVIGAFFLVRRSLFDELGGFDERFFMYFEEVDFSRRALLAGAASIYLGRTRAIHRGGFSSAQAKAARLFYSLRSRFRYSFKHFSRAEALAVVTLTLTVELITRLGKSALSLRPRDVLSTLDAYGRLLASGPRAWVGPGASVEWRRMPHAGRP